MPIGTAQPDPEQLQTVEHHFIASHDITEELSCGQYAEQALACLERLFGDHDWVVAVGRFGTLREGVVAKGWMTCRRRDPALRDELGRRLATEGIDALAEELRRLDPTYYEVVDRKNPARVVRALEVCLQTGSPLLRAADRQSADAPLRDHQDRELILPREELYDRINRRVDRMLADGLESEARRLYPYRALNALQDGGLSGIF